MELQVLPSAIAWIGRPLPIGWKHHVDWKGTNVAGLSLLYDLTRRLPDIFDSSAKKKKTNVAKRKRGY